MSDNNPNESSPQPQPTTPTGTVDAPEMVVYKQKDLNNLPGLRIEFISHQTILQSAAIVKLVPCTLRGTLDGKYSSKLEELIFTKLDSGYIREKLNNNGRCNLVLDSPVVLNKSSSGLTGMALLLPTSWLHGARITESDFDRMLWSALAAIRKMGLKTMAAIDLGAFQFLDSRS